MQPANLLPISTLSAGWADKDRVMLHACFQLLCDCIEQEELFEHTNWEQSPDFQQARRDLQELYEWWKERVAAEPDGTLPDLLEQQAQYEQDEHMLLRLVRLRRYLWT